MTAADLFRTGKLTDALAAQTAEVRAQPADNGRRLFLFELLAYAGDWERATKQIDAVSYDEPELQVATLSYRRLIDAEAARSKFFREGVRPQLLMPPPEHVRQRLDAADALRTGDSATAAALLAEANAVDSPGGVLNDSPVGAVRDGDDLFGPVLEVLANGGYAWVPIEQIDSLAISAPKFPRDLLWAPARLEVDGTSGEVFLPTIYYGSATAADELRLGRNTDWTGDASVRGIGAKLFVVDDEPLGLREWRTFVRG